VDRKVEGFRSFYAEDQSKLIEGEMGASMQVTKTGVYKIVLDFNSSSISYIEIKSIGVWFAPDDKIVLDLPYAGAGIWKGTGVIKFKVESWGKDERYKFQMTTIDKGKEVLAQWGAKNATDSRANASSPASYYYLKLLNEVTRWEDKWKFAENVDGRTSQISVVLQGDKEYTHIVEVK